MRPRSDVSSLSTAATEMRIHRPIRDIDFDAARIYATPMRTRLRGITVREGMLIAPR